MPETSARQMEELIRRYFAACDAGDEETLRDCFTPDAVHYFPADTRYGPWRGAEAIARGWATTAARAGAKWTVDRLLCDPDKAEAVIEWTQFRSRSGKILRGAEWYEFDPVTGLIAEIRAYFATPEAGDDRYELGGFDYAARGYPTDAP